MVRYRGYASPDSAGPAVSDLMERTWESGECWTCDAVNVPVLWIGPISTTELGHAPLTACATCIRRLEERIRRYKLRFDAPTVSGAPAPCTTGTPACGRDGAFRPQAGHQPPRPPSPAGVLNPSSLVEAR